MDARQGSEQHITDKIEYVGIGDAPARDLNAEAWDAIRWMADGRNANVLQAICRGLLKAKAELQKQAG